jgi:uncharacterized membrane protein YfcA
MSIGENNRLPLYAQVENVIISRIANGSLPPGIPPSVGRQHGLPIKVSSATSNFMICVTAAASAGAYLVRGDIVAPIAGPIALGSVVGAHFLMSISSERIRLLFA